MPLKIQNYGDWEGDKRGGHHPPACTCYACNEERQRMEAYKEEEEWRVAEYDRRVVQTRTQGQGRGQRHRSRQPNPSRQPPPKSSPKSSHRSSHRSPPSRPPPKSPHVSSGAGRGRPVVVVVCLFVCGRPYRWSQWLWLLLSCTLTIPTSLPRSKMECQWWRLWLRPRSLLRLPPQFPLPSLSRP